MEIAVWKGLLLIELVALMMDLETLEVTALTMMPKM